MASDHETSCDVNTYIGLNVGGEIYKTSRTTLTKYPNSFFSLLLEGSIPSTKDNQGNYLIDRDGRIFRHILNFLRSGELLTLPEGFKDFKLLESEADFFLLEDLKNMVNQIMPVGLLFDGGKVFNTTKETLKKESDSFFARMLAGEIEVTLDPQGNYVMDRDGSLFHHILGYLRDGGVLTDITLDEVHRLRNEADYFNLYLFKYHIQSIKFMETRRDALPFLHIYYCVDGSCFLYTNATSHQSYRLNHVCPNHREIMKGVFAGLADLQRIKMDDLVSTDDIVSYFRRKFRSGSFSDAKVLSTNCSLLEYEPF
nr:uncharacterized protein LOC129278256 [Lytechinus pictus]